jgi:ribose transport system ATP-binding protein
MDVPTAASLLEMRRVSKRFPGVTALSEARFDLRAGEVHVLLGENGAGKSTLMKILGGAVRMDAGDIRIDGHPVDIASPQRARALGVSLIYQELTLVPHLSVAENVFLGKMPARWGAIVDRSRMRDHASRILGSLGVHIDSGIPVRELRLAQQQMVEVARALADDARILIMDEPTSALTGAEVDQLFATIDRLKARGTAIVYISHRMEEVFRVGDRITVMRDGRTVTTLDVGEADVPRLVKLMADRDITEHYPRRSVARGDELLRVEGVSRRGVLHEVSFALHRGEIVGLAGLIGAGRSELARAIFGADPLDGGRVIVRGRAASLRTPAAAMRQGMALLPEDRKRHGLVLGLSVQRNIALPNHRRLAQWGIVDGRAERAEALRWIDALRIRTPSPLQRAVSLSGGNQQKIVLAKWLAAQADIFIFDEPTRGIDLAARQDIYALMNDLVARGAAVLMISSDLPEVLGMSDRILVMRQGSICAELNASEASEARVLHAALGAAS